MLSKTTKAIPFALAASAALILSGCASDANADSSPKPGDGVPAEQQAQKGLFEFQTPRYGAEGELTVRIPESLIKAAGAEADKLYVSEVKVTARELDSSALCAADLAITYRGAGLEELTKPEMTEAEHKHFWAGDMGRLLDREFGAGTIEEAREVMLERGEHPEVVAEHVSELEQIAAEVPPYEGEPGWDQIASADSADEFDPANPEAGSYISDDYKTLTIVQGCALSPMADDDTEEFDFPTVNEKGGLVNPFTPFASFSFSIMKGGTLTVTEAEVSDYQRDTNGNWIGG